MNKLYCSVDRIENNMAILEFPDKSLIEIDVSLLPSDIKEGSILVKISDNEYIHDFEEENARKKRLFDLQNKIFG